MWRGKQFYCTVLATMRIYGKEQFEADLGALGEVPHVTTETLDSMGEGEAAVVHGLPALGREDVALLHEYEPGSVYTAAGTAVEAYQPAATLGDKGITITAPETAVILDNPYALSIYLPDGQRGKGEALHYVAPQFRYVHEAASRYITAQEATDVIASTGIQIGDGLFMSQPEAQAQYAAYVWERGHNRADSFERFLWNLRTSVDYSVNLEEPHGTFTHDTSVSVTPGNYINRFYYVGKAVLAPRLGTGALYTQLPDGTVAKVVTAKPCEADFDTDYPALFTHGYTTVPRTTIDAVKRDLGDERERNTLLLADKQAGPLALKHSMTLDEALREVVLTKEDFTFAPADPLAMLYDALTNGLDTPYFKGLRQEIGPAFDNEAVKRRVIAKAHEQWHGFFAGRATLEPAASGLAAIANRLGIKNASVKRGVTVVTGNVTSHVSGGSYIIRSGGGDAFIITDTTY